jgi:phosphohistidine phosphatase
VLIAPRLILSTGEDVTRPSPTAIPLSATIAQMIYLLRHGDAEAGSGDDPARRLTGKGERQAEAAGKALANLGVGIDACLSSPNVRALDTARIVAEHLGVEVEVDDSLKGGDFEPLDLATGRGDVLLVGHEPDFSNAVAALTGAKVKLGKGGVAAVDDGTLHALLTPRQLRAIAGL